MLYCTTWYVFWYGRHAPLTARDPCTAYFDTWLYIYKLAYSSQVDRCNRSVLVHVMRGGYHGVYHTSWHVAHSMGCSLYCFVFRGLFIRDCYVDDDFGVWKLWAMLAVISIAILWLQILLYNGNRVCPYDGKTVSVSWLYIRRYVAVEFEDGVCQYKCWCGVHAGYVTLFAIEAQGLKAGERCIYQAHKHKLRLVEA